MCGILVARKGRGNDRFIKRRGQTLRNSFERNGLRFTHFLLHVTGRLKPQPIIDGDVVMLYNGEIYNLPYTESDGENIIPAYRDYGALFPLLLDGEFAVALYDFAADTAYFVADRFATKPLWRNGIECASYQSGVGGHKIAANTVETVRISTGQTLAIESYHQWDWRQQVTDYDACITAFEAAVAKRYKPGCFIGLSSGYDSGAIACALRGKDFRAYSIIASETRSLLLRRALLVGDCEIIPDFDRHFQQAHLRANAEQFYYNIRYDDGPGEASYQDDYAAWALSHICMLASREGRKVYLSGTGADEILSDYSLLPRQSEFKGTFPDPLRQWRNFVDSCQYSYLGKEECVGGSWNIETRYPFLDTAFVQSFLSLTADLKNRHYKAPLHEYLTREGFPFEAGKKIGFSPSPINWRALAAANSTLASAHV